MQTFEHYFSITKNGRNYSAAVLAELIGSRWVGSVKITSPSGNEVAYTDFSRTSIDNASAVALATTLFNSTVVDEITTGSIVTANGQTAYTKYWVNTVVQGTFYHEATAYADSARTQQICIVTGSTTTSANTYLSAQLKAKVETASAKEEYTIIKDITFYGMEYSVSSLCSTYFGFVWNLSLSVVCKNNNVKIETLSRTATAAEHNSMDTLLSNYFYSVVPKYLTMSTFQMEGTLYYTAHRVIARSNGTFNHCVALYKDSARTYLYTVTGDAIKSSKVLDEMIEDTLIRLYTLWFSGNYNKHGKYYFVQLIPEVRLGDQTTYSVQIKCLSNTLSFPVFQLDSEANTEFSFESLKLQAFESTLNACTETRTIEIDKMCYEAICRTMLKGVENGSPVYAKWGAVFHPEYAGRMMCKLDSTSATFNGELLSGSTDNTNVFSDLNSILNSVV